MKKFLYRLLLFLSPFLAFVFPPVFVLWKSCENFSGIDNIIDKNDKYLIGYAYNEQNYKYLKWETIVSKPKYQVIALGTSRVLQFRSNMFNTTFYNAGYTIKNIFDILPFLKSIPNEKYPDYLILGLDQFQFNGDFKGNVIQKEDLKDWTHFTERIPKFNTLINVWRDLISKKYSVRLPTYKNDIKYIGLNSIINNNGLRNDGSYFENEQIRKLLANDSSAVDYNYQNTFDRINKGGARFEFGENLNVRAVEELNMVLKYCKLNRITVIGFIPPFADKVNAKMSSIKKYKYMNAIYPKSLEIFTKYGYELYDFASLKTCNSNDNETLDGFHGGELTYLKILIKILESNSILNNVADLKKLYQDLDNKLNRYEIY